MYIYLIGIVLMQSISLAAIGSISGQDIWSLKSSIDASVDIIGSLTDELSADSIGGNQTVQDAIEHHCSKLELVQNNVTLLQQTVCSSIDATAAQATAFQDASFSKLAGIDQDFTSTRESLNQSLQDGISDVISFPTVVVSKIDAAQNTVEVTGGTLCSKIEEINQQFDSATDQARVKVEDLFLDTQLFRSTIESKADFIENSVNSIQDVLCSRIEGVETNIESLQDLFLNDLQENEGQVQLISDKVESGLESLQQVVQITDQTSQSKNDATVVVLESVSDALSSQLDTVQTKIQNAQTSFVEKLDAQHSELISATDIVTTDLQNIDNNFEMLSLQAVSKIDVSEQINSANQESLSSKIEVVEQLLQDFDSSTSDELQNVLCDVTSISDKILTAMMAINSTSDIIVDQLFDIETIVSMHKDEIIETVCDKIAFINNTINSTSDVIAESQQQIDSVYDVVCTKIASADSGIGSSIDVVSNQVDPIQQSIADDLIDVDSKLDVIHEALFSVSDQFVVNSLDTEMGLTSIYDSTCMKFAGINDTIFSISDVATQVIADSEPITLSVVDALCTKITIFDNNILSVSDIVAGLGDTQICDRIASLIDVHDEKICSKIESFEPQCELVLMAIEQDDMPLTITDSGIYRVTESLTGNITINTSGVQLDLQGNVVEGTIEITSGPNVCVQNGFLKSASSGLLVTSVPATEENIIIRDLFITESDNNIIISASAGVLVERCRISELSTLATDAVLVSGASENIVIKDCVADGNRARFRVTGSPTGAIIFDRCIAQNNTIASAEAFEASIATTTHELILRDCIAQNFSSATSIGFFMGENAIVENCIAIDVGTGFEVVSSSTDSTLFKNCFAVATTQGSGGAFRDDENLLQCYNCAALFCAQAGFQAGSSGSTDETTCVQCLSHNCDLGFFAQLATTWSRCTATANTSEGFQTASSGAATPSVLLKDGLASHNGAEGIDDNGKTITIFDTRSVSNALADTLSAGTLGLQKTYTP